MRAVRLAWDLLRAEGPRGLGARLADRFDELRRRVLRNDADLQAVAIAVSFEMGTLCGECSSFALRNGGDRR